MKCVPLHVFVAGSSICTGPGMVDTCFWGLLAHGADVAGTQGAVTTRQLRENVPSWLPAVDTR